MDIVQKLRQEIPNLPKKLALAARYAVDYPDQIALNSMRSAANTVGVTSTTMLRLARQLGFENYEDFKASFQTQLISTGFGARAGALHRPDGDATSSVLSERLLASSKENLRLTLSATNLANLSDVAHLIRDAPKCLLVGSGAAYVMATLMKATGSMILPNLRVIGPEYAVAAEDIGTLCDADVVIGIGLNPCATRTVDALKFSKAQGARIIAMTDRPSSPLVEHADFALFAETSSPHYYPSLGAMVGLIETLLATVVAEGDEEEQRRINDFEKRRKLAGRYIEY
ncbi:MAG: MurR/RpiR family transcriptional regulator [Pseudomonadota bacterium]